MKVWFDPSSDSFYLEQWFPEQPEGTLEIPSSLHAEMMNAQDAGLVISHDKNGSPVAIEPPEPVLTQEELISLADNQKAALIDEAKDTISLWQTELQLGIISDDDKTRLIEWMKYIQALNAVDTSTAPNITWPDKPE